MAVVGIVWGDGLLIGLSTIISSYVSPLFLPHISAGVENFNVLDAIFIYVFITDVLFKILFIFLGLIAENLTSIQNCIFHNFVMAVTTIIAKDVISLAVVIRLIATREKTKNEVLSLDIIDTVAFFLDVF